VTGRVLAVCIVGLQLFDVPGSRVGRSGIDKRPIERRVSVQQLGLDGDAVLDHRDHGGEGQAVYCYGQEDAEWWELELDRSLPPGRFGENLRTAGIDLTGAVLGERWRIGTALFEVTAPRIPCATFERFWAVPQLVKRFTARGATGAYLRVLETGDVGAGDAIEVVFRPDHGITTGRAFRLLTTEQSQLPELEPALRFLPIKDQARVGATIEAKIATRTAASSSAGEPTAAF
jgi:MOSC domain-containing protein YiiM